MKSTPLLILLALLLDLVDMVIARYATHVPAGFEHPEFRVFQYGRRSVWAYDRGESESFFLLKLPSWEWREALWDYGRISRWCWHQRVLMWTSTRGWEVWLQAEPLHAAMERMNRRVGD